MTKKYYAGIGSRKTPGSILSLMRKIAIKLEKSGYTLRSGGAKGADSAFECDVEDKIIYKAADYDDRLRNYIDRFHASPQNVKPGSYAEKLLGRNVLILLGDDLESDVDFIICWTPDGEFVGGTGFTLRVGASRQISIYNLYYDEIRARFRRWLS